MPLSKYVQQATVSPVSGPTMNKSLLELKGFSLVALYLLTTLFVVGPVSSLAYCVGSMQTRLYSSCTRVIIHVNARAHVSHHSILGSILPAYM